MGLLHSVPPPGERDLVHEGKVFLEQARNDQWRANILLQLAESIGDEVEALSGYIDMLLSISVPPGPSDERPADGSAKYLGWLAELGRLECRPG